MLKYVPDSSPLLVCGLQVFSPGFTLSFHPHNRSVHRTKVFEFDAVPFTRFSWITSALGVKFNNPKSRTSPNLQPQRFSLMFFSKSRILLGSSLSQPSEVDDLQSPSTSGLRAGCQDVPVPGRRPLACACCGLSAEVNTTSC